MMSIGTRIAQLRKSKGWTQSQLAKEAKLSASTIAMYETSRRSPDKEALNKLATALRVNPNMLVDEAIATGSLNSTPQEASEQKSIEQKSIEPASIKQVSTKKKEPAGPSSPAAHAAEKSQPSINLTTFSLTAEEARIILFIRMNRDCLPFLESYIKADRSRREQLEATWRLVQEFHPS